MDSRFSTAEPLDAFIKITFAGFEGSNSILGHTKSKDMFLTMMRSKINKNLGNATISAGSHQLTVDAHL